MFIITGMCISPHAIPVGLFLAGQPAVKSTGSYPAKYISIMKMQRFIDMYSECVRDA